MKKLFLIFLSCISIVSFSQSSINWTAGMNIASNSYGNYYPRITTEASGNPLVIWSRSSDASVFISRWNGTSFTTPVKVNPSWLTVASGSWMGPDIASKGDTVYVVMKQTPEADTASHIYGVRSFDGGITFSPPGRIDFIGDSISRFPTVTTDAAGNPIVGFMKFNSSFLDSRWVVTKSNNYGNTFSTDVKASGWSGAGAVVCDCCPGAITCSGNSVAMLYRDNLSNVRDMWAGISSDGGNSFPQGIPVDQKNWVIPACPASGPDGVIIGDTLYTAFMSGAGGSNLVYLSKSSLSSMTGSTGIRVTGTFAGLTQQNYPRIAGAGNALAIAWKQIVNGGDQLALRFTSNIANGFSAGYDTVDLNDITNTDVAITNGNIFIVWEDDASGTVKYRAGTFTPTTSVNETISENQFSVFPNPTTGGFTVYDLPSEAGYELKITNMIGETVLQKTGNHKEETINLNGRSGIYFLEIISGQQSLTRKLIVTH